MGIVKKVFKGAKSIIGGVAGGMLGGGQPKSPAIQPQAKAPTSTQSAAEIAQQEDEERRKRLLALNASGAQGQLTNAGGDTSTAPVTRKMLLGQ